MDSSEQVSLVGFALKLSELFPSVEWSCVNICNPRRSGGAEGITKEMRGVGCDRVVRDVHVEVMFSDRYGWHLWSSLTRAVEAGSVYDLAATYNAAMLASA